MFVLCILLAVLKHNLITGLFSRLVGDVLMCTAFLSYSGPFNQDFRLLLNKSWTKEMKTRKIPFTANLNVVDLLTEPTTVSKYLMSGGSF